MRSEDNKPLTLQEKKEALSTILVNINRKVNLLNDWHNHVNVRLAKQDKDIEWIKKAIPISAIILGFIQIIIKIGIN